MEPHGRFIPCLKIKLFVVSRLTRPGGFIQEAWGFLGNGGINWKGIDFRRDYEELAVALPQK